jgi:DNA polymerase-4/DNA polymerase V
MNDRPLTIGSFPRAIIHIDGDAFFASCEQARNPKLQGKPVITGKERGIASSMSYEAKAKGVKRGMRISDILKVCPDAIILPSDYETYSLLSERLYSIVRRYTPEVEEYSIDECFADITGLRRTYRCSYVEIAEKIKHDLDTELGFTFSVGLGPNKVIAKVGSKWKKPSGLTAIPGKHIHLYLEKLPVNKIWGIGTQTTAFLNKQNVFTALDFAQRSEEWVQAKLTKPFHEIWQELNGAFIYPLALEQKQSYATIQKMKTFTPPTNDRSFIFAQLSKNIENACIKARRYKLAAKGAIFFLRTQDFQDIGIEVRFSRPTSIPSDMIKFLESSFERLYRPGRLFRSTGIVLLNLTEQTIGQIDLFGDALKMSGMVKLYESIDAINAKYGKHKVYLGSSYGAHAFAQHLGDRGETPERTKTLFKGETKRKRLGIPMFAA